jgi:hypothetical protein
MQDVDALAVGQLRLADGNVDLEAEQGLQQRPRQPAGIDQLQETQRQVDDEQARTQLEAEAGARALAEEVGHRRRLPPTEHAAGLGRRTQVN